MNKYLVSAFLLSASVGARAQPAAMTVALSNFSFSPNAIQLRAGVPTTLRLQNASGGGHNFSAPEFFAAARVDPKSASYVRNGTVEVPKHGTVNVTLVPATGRYSLRCTHTLHSAFGMRGSIVVN